MVNSFANDFWDEDFNGTTGYDFVVTRLKDGKKLYDAFSEFLKNRAKLEDEYGKNLMKLAVNAGGNEETGSLKTSWECIKKETENIGMIHCELSKRLNELLERSMKYREKQKQERISVDGPIRLEQKEKKASHEAMLKVRRSYELRCKEYDAAKEAYQSKSAYTPKEEEKLKRNMQRCKTNVESSDSNYMTSVRQLEDLRKKYILNMEDACEKFQAIEEERIKFLRNEMWTYTNDGSLQCLNISDKYEDCRMLLEKCSEKQDLQVFINSRNTGSVRPTAVEYVNYYYNDNNTSPTDWSTNIPTKNSSNANLVNEDRSSSAPNLVSSNNNNNNSSQSANTATLPSKTREQNVHSSSNPAGQIGHHEVNLHDKPDDYADVSDVRALSPINKSTRRVRATFVYQSQSARELNLNRGDIIEIEQIVDDTWALGVLDGKKGAFPLAFVEAHS